MTDVQEAMVKLRKFSRSRWLLDLVRKGPILDRGHKNSFVVQGSTGSLGRKLLLMILFNPGCNKQELNFGNKWDFHFFKFQLKFTKKYFQLETSLLFIFSQEWLNIVYLTYKPNFSWLLYQNSTGILLLSELQNIEISPSIL